MLKKTLAAAGLSLFSFLTVALPASAQEVATLVLRNGERPSGQLIDMTGSGFVVRINGQDRTFGSGEVAAIEFVVGDPGAAANAKINSGQPFVILRNGQIIDGRLSDIGGTSPLRLTVDTPSGSRDFMSNEVSQVYVNPVPGAAAASASAATAATAPAPIPAGAIPVPANVAWTDTGVTIRRADRLVFSSTGDVMISPTASSGVGGSPAVTNPSVRYPVQGAPAGALIGRVGNGTPFLIGSNTAPITVSGNGRLMVGINDDVLTDNTGQFYVTITRPVR
jgi:hypothetical protein